MTYSIIPMIEPLNIKNCIKIKTGSKIFHQYRLSQTLKKINNKLFTILKHLYLFCVHNNVLTYFNDVF